MDVPNGIIRLLQKFVRISDFLTHDRKEEAFITCYFQNSSSLFVE